MEQDHYCLYSPNKMAKVAWKQLKWGAPMLQKLLQLYSWNNAVRPYLTSSLV